MTNIPEIAFTFADVFGDLKIRLKQPHKEGSYLLSFNSIDDLSHIIHSLDFQKISDDEQPINEGDINTRSGMQGIYFLAR